MPPTTRRAAPVCLALLIVSCTSLTTQAIEDEETQTIRRMVDAGLNQVALDYIQARRQLAANDLDAQSKWVMRLAEYHALTAARAGNEQAWNSAATVLDQFLGEHSTNRRNPWLAWQRARCEFLQAQSELAARLAAPGNEARRDKVLSLVRATVGRLEELKRDITQRLQVAAQQRGEGAQASAKQLNQLQVDASLLICESVWLRVQLYPAGSKDRIAAATLLTATAEEVLTRTDGQWASRPQLEIVNAAGQLQQAGAATGLQTLRRLASEAPTSTLRTTAAQLAISHLTSVGEASLARSLLPAMDPVSPLASLAHMQVALTELDNLTESTRETQLTRIVSLAKDLRLQFGEYWGNRGDALLISSGASRSIGSTSNTALDLLRVEVKQLIAAEKIDAAIEKLRGRIEIESAIENAAGALDLAGQTAALLHRQGASLDAANALAPVALQFATDARAAKQHRLALAYIQQALVKNPTDNAIHVTYESALRTQLTTWPTSEESNLPAEWLTIWLAGQQRTDELLQILWAKASAGTAESAAIDLVRWLDAFGGVADTARALQADPNWATSDESEVAQMQSCVLAIAKLLADWQPTQTQTQLLKLTRSVSSSTESDATGTIQAMQAGIECLAAVRNQDVSAAREAISNWQRTDLESGMLRALGVALVEAIDFTPVNQHGQWSKSTGMDRGWFSVLQEGKSTSVKAAGLRMQGWVDGPSTSIEGLESLRKQFPNDANVLLQLSLALAESGDNRLADSTRLAKIVIKNTKPGSPMNLLARWRWLENLRLGPQSGEAKSQAKYFLAVSPPTDPVWLRRFEAIAK